MRRIQKVWLVCFVSVFCGNFVLFADANAMNVSDRSFQSFSGRSHRISIYSARRPSSEQLFSEKVHTAFRSFSDQSPYDKIRKAIRSLFSRSHKDNKRESKRFRQSRLSRIFLGSQSSLNKSPYDRLPFLFVKIYCNPSVEIWKLPTEENLIFNGHVISHSLYMPGGSVYGDTTIKIPLFLTSDMNNDLFVYRILTAFGLERGICMTGIISRRKLFKLDDTYV